MDLKELQKQFLEIMATSRSENTLKAYKADLDAFGFKSAITPMEVNRKVSEWLASDISRATIKRRYFSLVKFLKRMHRNFDPADIQDIINDAGDFKAPPSPPARYPTIEDFKRIIARTDAQTAYIMGLMFYTSLRIGDVVRLTKDNFTERDGIKVIEIQTKKTCQYTIIPVIDKLLDLQSKYGAYAVGVGVRCAEKKVKVACEDAGYAGMTCHSFRHGFSSALHNNKVPDYLIEYMMSHADHGVADRYMHISPVILKEELDRVFMEG